MTILTKRSEWRVVRPSNETRRSTDLTPEEQANMRRALLFLRARYGSWAKLATALRAKHHTVERAGGYGRPVGAGLAVRAARLAGVPLDDLLSGAWPGTRCPTCGRL